MFVKYNSRTNNLYFDKYELTSFILTNATNNFHFDKIWTNRIGPLKFGSLQIWKCRKLSLLIYPTLCDPSFKILERHKVWILRIFSILYFDWIKRWKISSWGINFFFFPLKQLKRLFLRTHSCKGEKEDNNDWLKGNEVFNFLVTHIVLEYLSLFTQIQRLIFAFIPWYLVK